LLEILDHFYQKLSMETRRISLVQQSMEKALSLEGFLLSPGDTRPSHGDLNPSNVLFDGSKYWLVDWQAAAPRNLYFDLACCATFFYFFNENLCIQFLKDYFDREVTQEEMEKYQLMRMFSHIYYGIGFIAISGELDPHLSLMSDDELEKLPSYLAFMQDIGAGKVNLGSAKAQQQFGFIFLKTAVDMMNKS
jgi:thiamine kinase-like enzyme